MMRSLPCRIQATPSPAQNRAENLRPYFPCLKGTSGTKPRKPRRFPCRYCGEYLCVCPPPSMADLIRRADESLLACGKRKVVLRCKNTDCWEHEAHYYITPHTCGIRICKEPKCLAKRVFRATRKYEDKVNQMKTPRFLTLTIRGWQDEVSRKHLDLLHACWKVFSQYYRRKRKIWAYIKAIEIADTEYFVGPFLESAYGYFYHMHVIYDGQYIPFDSMQEKWKEITKAHVGEESHRVEISKPKARFKIHSYIAKYIGKGSDLEISTESYIGIRKCQFFASWCDREILIFLKVQHEVCPKIMCPACGSRMSVDSGLSEWESRGFSNR